MQSNPLNILSLKAQFTHHLESLHNLTPEAFTGMTAFIVDLGSKIQLLASEPEKTEEDIKHIEQVSAELQKFITKLSEAQISMRKKEWNDTEAYYLQLKEDAKGGDATALTVLTEFEPIYYQMKDRIQSDQEIEFPSSRSLKYSNG